MRIIKIKNKYKKRLLFFTAFTTVVCFSDVSGSYADVCSDGTNGADCTVDNGSIVSVSSIDAGNVNNASSQWGTLEITAGDSSFGGNVYLYSLQSADHFLNFTSGAIVQVNNLISNGVNSDEIKKGNLFITGTGVSYFYNPTYLEYIEATNATLNISDYVEVNSIAVKNINSSAGSTLNLVGNDVSSAITGNVYLSAFYSQNNNLSLSGLLEADIVDIKNINSSSSQSGTLRITGTSDSTLSGNAYLSALNAANNTLNINGSVQSETVRLNNINSSSSQVGTLTITGTGTSTLSGNAYLSALNATNNTLNFNGSVQSGTVRLNNINSSSNQVGTLTITGTGTSTLSGNVYVSEMSLTNNGTAIFSGVSSKINNVFLNDGTMVVNNGQLSVAKISSSVAKIYGTGTLLLDNGYIDSTGGNKLAHLIVGSGTVNLSYGSQDVNIGSVIFQSTTGGTVVVTGSGNDVVLDSFKATSLNNKLNINNGATLDVSDITAYAINTSGSQNGTINVSNSGVFNGEVNLANLNILDGASITFGSGFKMNGSLNMQRAANINISNKTYLSYLGGIFSNGLVDDRTYTLMSGTWTGNGGAIYGVEGESSAGATTGTFQNGIFQNAAGGILIGQQDPNAPLTINFNGGVLWDYSAYLSSLPSGGSVVLSNGETAYNNTLYGDISISGGILQGQIDIRKGNSQSIFYSKDSKGETKEYSVSSSGNINVSGGVLNFTDDRSQILMYGQNTGSINISGGQWNVNSNALVSGEGNDINIIGGQFSIAQGKTLTLSAKSGTMQAPSSTFSIDGQGTLNLQFDSFSIASTINWTDGILKQTGGTLNINAPVTVHAYNMDGANASLVISGVLSITNNLMMNGNLSGSGELKLSEKASATVGTLTGFGTISVGRGEVTFIKGNDTNDLSLSVLNGASGNAGENVGTININARLVVDTVNLGNSTLNLNRELVVNNLNFDNGRVVFLTDQTPLTLTNSTTIWNTSQIITDPAVVPNATDGVLTIKDGMTLSFADQEGATEHFESPNLTVNVENGAQVVFSAAETSFGSLKMTQGSASVKSGILNVGIGVLGDQTAATGNLNVDAGAVSNFETLTANKGSTLTVDGTLNVENLIMNGSVEQWATLTGSGSVKITDSALFEGRITNLQNLQIVGQSSDEAVANFNGSTGYPDAIGTMEVVYGTVNLNKGSLTLDSLSLDHGTVLLNGEDVVLALKQSPSEDSGITGEGNSISGIGTLELLNDTSISFGGGNQGSIKYLGGLKIGTGTATITADTTLGSVQFSSSQGGILQINTGAALQLSDENGGCSRNDNCRITTNAGNIVQGEGTLNLLNGDGSVFAGQVNLNELILGKSAGTISFNYAGQSNLNTFTVNSGGANVVVNNGILVVQNTFGNENTNVYGTGTLFVNNGTFKNASGQLLANLIVGSGTVNVGSANIGNISFNSDTEGVLNLSQNLTVSGNITVNAGNAIKGSKLILSGTAGIGNFNAGLDALANLNLENGATAHINVSTQVGSGGAGLVMNDNAKVVIASGAELSVKNSTLGKDASSVITGDGTLDLTGVTVNSILDNLNNLSTSGGVSTTTSASTISNSVTIADGTTLNFAGGSVNNATYVNGTLNITDNTKLFEIIFDENGGTLGINDGTILTVNKNITLKSNDVLTGTGTLFLDGSSSGVFAMNTAFDGTIKIGSGTAYIQTNAAIGAIGFADNTGGVLDIADNNILTVGTIVTDGVNKITGNGTLNLTGQGSSFKAPIDNLGTLMVSNGGTAEFYNNINIGTLAFSNGGEVNLISGMTMNVNSMTQSGTNGIVYGEGSFVAGSGNVAFSTGNKNLAAATIGTGVLNFIGDSKIGSLTYSSVEGTINIEDNVTVVIGSDFSGIGKLTGAATSRLQLEGQASATFDKANEYKGTISAGNGSLTFLSDTNFKSLILNSAYARFYRQSFIDEVWITDGFAEFDLMADVKFITISDKGAVYFKDTANLGALNIGAGTAIFEKNATLGNGSIASGGKLDIDVNTLTFNVGNFSFNDNSNFMMRISREATDEMGNVNATGYGKLVFNGGTLNIGNNVKLDITIDYGLQTAEGGSVFQLVEGSKTGFFVFENNRYDLKEETCSSGNGICYRLTQTSTGGQVAQEEAGNQNQVNTATAFLDGELFDYGTKAFEVAEHLDALSQKKGGHSDYLKALTAVSPDVTGAMTRQPIALHSKVTNTVSSRLNGLMGNMGSSSRTYREIQQMYGRSGGSPYNSRFMRAQDYYRRAGYYDQDDQPTPRPRPAYRRRVDPDSQEAVETTAERKRWAKRRTSYTQPKNFGLWAQAFYNTADYMSVSKPEGFSGDTTGIAIGADMQLFDVFAVGIGYASTTTSLDSLQRSTDISGDSFFLYGMYKPSDWFVSSVLNMTSMTYDETKDLSGLTLSDSYDGSSFGASIMFGKDLKTWTPAVGLRYVSAGRDAHKDEVGQDISSVSTSALTFVAEGRFSRDFAKTNNSLWHSELSAALTYDFSASGEDAVVNLPNGSSYTVVGDDFDPLGVELGASIAYLLGDHVDISAGYNLEWRPDYMSHSLTAMFRYSF